MLLPSARKSCNRDKQTSSRWIMISVLYLVSLLSLTGKRLNVIVADVKILQVTNMGKGGQASEPVKLFSITRSRYECANVLIV